MLTFNVLRKDEDGGQLADSNRDRGRRIGRAPPTPPGMRVRTGRFEKLRSRELGHAQAVEERNVQQAVHAQSAGVPPLPQV